MSARITAIWRELFERSARPGLGLQGQLREMMVAAILDGQLPADTPLPSSRAMAAQLGVARNTVVLAYQQLTDEGFLVSRPRSGHFVDAGILGGRVRPLRAPAGDVSRGVDWRRRLAMQPASQRSIVKPEDWQRYPYPFLYGQLDPTLFPTAEWRECCRKTLSAFDIREWAPDRIDGDDERLVQQIRTRVLPRRGIWASADELMVTVGAQHALYMVADLLVREGTRVAIEDPGYPDARNIFATRTARLVPIPVDRDGLPVGERLRGCDYVYTTPGHQCPTGVTMPLERRRALLRLAEDSDLVVIEDDYEGENRFDEDPVPALKSLDRGQRVIHVGSLSKHVAPGLRIGYVVAPAPLIAELRALRRLMLRHPSTFIQRAFALFLSLGHHDAQLRRLAAARRERCDALLAAIARHAPGCAVHPVAGGGACWVRLPDGVRAQALGSRAARRGVLVEPGDVFFHRDPPPANFVRLGCQSIALERIEPGIREFAAALEEVRLVA